MCNYKKWGRKFRKPCVIVSWNLKFQESSEWKSEVGSDDEYYDEEDSDDFEDEEDEGDEEVDEDKVCSRTKKAVPNQDQPYYHILMVEDGENNPVQHKLNVPEGNLRLTFAFSAPFTNPNIFLVFVTIKESLELLPAAVAIKHDNIWFHFERFDGRRYVPNTEKRAQFPEDEEVTLSLIG